MLGAGKLVQSLRGVGVGVTVPWEARGWSEQAVWEGQLGMGRGPSDPSSPAPV